MSSTQKPSLAILDDYAGIAPAHFQRIPGLQIDSYFATLDPSQPADFDKLVSRLQPYEIISTMRERTPFPATLLQALPNLKLLMTTSTRNASIDMEAAAKLGIVVTGTQGGRPTHAGSWSGVDLPPPPEGNSVIQHAWALLLGLCARLPADDYALKTDSSAWQSGLTIPLGGKTMGVVGLGKLGSMMARTAVGFGMKVVAWSENLTEGKADAEAEKMGLPRGTFRAVGKEELFRTADVVSLHLVLSERSRGVVGQKEIAMMKPSAFVVNTSRGGLIDEAALLKALREGRIRGAALDVFWQEPLPPDSPWRSRDFKSQVVLSPHMGYANAGTMERWYEEQAEIASSWLSGGKIPNQIN